MAKKQASPRARPTKKRAKNPGTPRARPTKKRVQTKGKTSKSAGKGKLYSPEEIVAYRSMAMSSMVDYMSVETGSHNALVGEKADRIHIGVPIPFAFAYLAQSNVFPLGIMVQIVGEEGTCKTGLAFEMGRWFTIYDGFMQFLENESKFSPGWAQSIMGYPDELGHSTYNFFRCHSIEDWQAYLQAITVQTKEIMSDPRGPGRIFPTLIVLDSIMGKLSEETQLRIESTGYADRAYPKEAMQITAFLKKYPQDLIEWPISFVAINHLKKQKDDRTPVMKRRKAGGTHISFQETWEIEMAKGERSKIKLLAEDDAVMDTGGIRLRLSCKKNSLGETHRSIVVEVLWQYHDGPDGRTRQYTKWNWPGAAVDLLCGYEGDRAKKVKNIVDINRTTGSKYWSKRLRVPKTAPLAKTDFGIKLEAETEVIKQLYKLFAIYERKVFIRGKDFLVQYHEDEDVLIAKNNRE